MSVASVCFLLPRFEMGGLERVHVHITGGLTKAGIQTILVTRRIEKAAESLLRPYLPIVALGGSRLAFIYKLIRWLRKTKPRIIVTGANDIGCLILLLRSVFWRGSRVVWTQHLSISGPLTSSKGIKRIKLLVERLLMRHLLKFADEVVAVSEAVADDIRHQIEAGMVIRVIHNPVVFEGFEQQSREAVDWPWPDHNAPTVVFVGRLAPVKRIDLLLEAFSQCLQAMPLRLLVVGEGSEYGAALRMAAALDIQENCRFTGFCANPLPLIRQSELLVSCSDAEGFGVVLVEAMACGTQVVSTDCPSGPAEVLDHGRYGRLVPVGDAEALAAAILTSLQFPLVDEAQLIQRASEFGVQRAVSSYSEMFRACGAAI